MFPKLDEIYSWYKKISESEFWSFETDGTDIFLKPIGPQTNEITSVMKALNVEHSLKLGYRAESLGYKAESVYDNRNRISSFILHDVNYDVGSMEEKIDLIESMMTDATMLSKKFWSNFHDGNILFEDISSLLNVFPDISYHNKIYDAHLQGQVDMVSMDTLSNFYGLTPSSLIADINHMRLTQEGWVEYKYEMVILRYEGFKRISSMFNLLPENASDAHGVAVNKLIEDGVHFCTADSMLMRPLEEDDAFVRVSPVQEGIPSIVNVTKKYDGKGDLTLDASKLWCVLPYIPMLSVVDNIKFETHVDEIKRLPETAFDTSEDVKFVGSVFRVNRSPKSLFKVAVNEMRSGRRPVVIRQLDGDLCFSKEFLARCYPENFAPIIALRDNRPESLAAARNLLNKFGWEDIAMYFMA